ncbi:hypothetical protein ACH5RR_004063 [Cinchona calisaya]|uniref:Serine aminopeptidase S33 domain-containing protein n=1 Tax=Cinchona calisaya TaxID=153742 RepID=A0ABD3AXC9_9GENT
MAINAKTEQKKITLEKDNGSKLVGLLHDETGSPDVVILCHGYRSSKESRTIVEIADALKKDKISTFRFDFSGNGESEGTFQYSNYSGEVEDLRAVIGYFTRNNRRISALIGHSKGGNVVLLYASKYHDIGKVINVSGRFHLDQGIADRFGADYLERIKKDGYIDVKNRKGKFEYRVMKQCVMDRLDINMNDSCLLIDKECRVLTIHGSADEITPLADAFQFDKIIPNHKLEIVKGASHCYTVHKVELTSAVLSFIKDDFLQQVPL